jgi:hypothetical protein
LGESDGRFYLSSCLKEEEKRKREKSKTKQQKKEEACKRTILLSKSCTKLANPDERENKISLQVCTFFHLFDPEKRRRKNCFREFLYQLKKKRCVRQLSSTMSSSSSCSLSSSFSFSFFLRLSFFFGVVRRVSSCFFARTMRVIARELLRSTRFVEAYQFFFSFSRCPSATFDLCCSLPLVSPDSHVAYFFCSEQGRKRKGRQEGRKEHHAFQPRWSAVPRRTVRKRNDIETNKVSIFFFFSL